MSAIKFKDLIFGNSIKGIPKPDLSKQKVRLLTNWAKEAHEIDPSKPISYYYKMFETRMLENKRPIEQKSIFFKGEVIET